MKSAVKSKNAAQNGKSGIYPKYIKRFFDIICSLLAITVFCWLYLIIAILVKINLGSPIVFKQERPGKNEKIFKLYKFRTMTDERDGNGNLLPDEKRITKFGRWLRGSSLDELPEAFNILKGDMSVVGPRPQLVRDMVFMTQDQRTRHTLRPGLSGLAQVSGRNALAWEEKLRLDIVYINSISFWLDVKIILKTVKNVFLKREKDVESGKETTFDYGDYLLSVGKVDKSDYDNLQNRAKELLNSRG